MRLLYFFVIMIVNKKRIFMKSMKFFLFAFIILLLTGCKKVTKIKHKSIDYTKSSIKYDIYYCGKDGIYGAKINSLPNFTEILKLSKDSHMDSCAIDSEGNLYWSNRTTHGIYKSDLNGNNIQQIVSGLDIPLGIAIDEKDRRVYWTNWLQSQKPQTAEVGYCDFNGDNKKTIIRNLASGGKLLLLQDKLYISDLFGGTILRSNLEGENLELVTEANQPEQIAFDSKNNSIIWGDVADDKIVSTNITTLESKDLIVFDDQFTNPEAVAVDQKRGRIFFIKPVENNGLGQNPSRQLHSSNLEGGDIKIYKNLPVSLWDVHTLLVLKK